MKNVGLMMLAIFLALTLSPALTAQAQESADPDVAAYESAILGALIDDAATAKAVVEICVERSYRTEVVAWCQAALAEAEQQIAQLNARLGEWHGNGGYLGQLSEGDAALVAQLRTIDDAQFEERLLSNWLYLDKQASAVAVSYQTRECSDGGKMRDAGRSGEPGCSDDRQDRADLLTYTHDLVSLLARQTTTLDNWYSAWYGG